MCNSIRISDHKGKKRLSYRYNIGFDIKQKYNTDNQFTRYFFPALEYEKLITMCINDRKLKMLSYGHQRYSEFMNDNRERHADSKGFWKEAKHAIRRRGKIYYES